MYRVIDQTNMQLDQLPRNGSLINFSLLRELKTEPVIFRSFSVKYVVDGCENYTVNGKRFNVRNGEYLLANTSAEGSVEIDSEKIVRGLCIDIAPSILSEVVASHIRPDTAIPDNVLDDFFTGDSFFENFYPSDKTAVGKMLQELGDVLSEAPHEKREFTREFYFTLSERLVADHIPLIRSLREIPAVRTETRKDLLRKVLKGKYYIDEMFTQPLVMETVARECGLSEYHFFRLFRFAFQDTPHQYLIRRRLEYALQLFSAGSASITDAALICGFPDVQSFSKSFRKHYGVSPSRYHHL